jgi:hypothetical protein
MCGKKIQSNEKTGKSPHREEETDADRRGGDGFSRRFVLKGAVGAAAAGVGIQGMSGTVEAASVELSNDSITVPVDNNGAFRMFTADGRPLLYPTSNTSNLTVQVDGTNYTVPGNLTVESGTELINDGQTARTEYLTPENVRVYQDITLAGGAVSFELDILNEGNQPVEVNVRYLFDYQVDNQDGAPIFVDGEVLVTETRFENPTFSTWQTYDQLPDPNLTGTGAIADTPTKIEFVAWEDAINFAYSYDAFDPEKDFYTPGQNNSPASDSAGLLYWEEGVVDPGGSRAIQTYYGTEEPVSDAQRLLDAVESYRTTANNLIDEFVQARAEESARLYKEYGDDYLEPRIAYWGYRGDVDGVDESDIPDEVQQAMDQLFATSIRDDYAEQFYHALTEMWGEVEQTAPVEEIASVIGEHLRGTADGQENPPAVCESGSYGDDDGGDGGVLGSTISEVQSGFNEGVDTSEQFISDTVDEAEDIGTTGYRTTTRFVKNRERDLRNAQLGQKADTAVSTLLDAPNQANLNVTAAAPLVAVPATGGGGLVSVGSAGAVAPEPTTTIAGLVILGAVGAGVAIHKADLPEIRLPSAYSISRDNTFNNQGQPQIEEPMPTVTPSGPGGPDMLDRIAQVLNIISDISDVESVLSQELEIEDLSVGEISENDVIEKEGGVSVLEVDGTITIRNPEDAPSLPIQIRPFIFPPETRVTRLVQGETLSPQIEFTGATVEDSLVPSEGLPVPQDPTIPGDPIPIPPGNAREYSFTFEVPVANAAFEWSAYTEVYELQIAITSRVFGLGVVSETVTFTAGEGAGNGIDLIESGSVAQGESRETTSTLPGDSQRATYRLSYSGGDLDLGLYDSAGNHVGINYETGEFENEIPNASVSGPDDGAGSEWITVDELTGGETFDTELVAIETSGEADTYSITETTGPEIPATLDLAESRLRVAVLPGEQRTRTVGLSEIGGSQGFETVSLDVSSLEDDGTVLGATVEFSDNDFTLDPAGTQSVSITVSVPDDAASGVYTGDLSVSGTADGETQAQTVSTSVEVPPPPLPASENRPRDLDVDGLYEDIDGDGELTIFDVQEFFLRFESQTVQDNAVFFKFQEDSEDEEISIFDVQALFVKLNERV